MADRNQGIVRWVVHRSTLAFGHSPPANPLEGVHPTERRAAMGWPYAFAETDPPIRSRIGGGNRPRTDRSPVTGVPFPGDLSMFSGRFCLVALTVGLAAWFAAPSPTKADEVRGVVKLVDLKNRTLVLTEDGTHREITVRANALTAIHPGTGKQSGL